MHAPRIEVTGLLKRFAADFDRHLERYLKPEEGVPGELAEAVRYAALAPGKRLRPFLLVRCCELAGGRREDAWAAGAAIECVHAFSLVHDDLPAMDDDDLRRGRLTTHKKFGEALGILAGDALVVRAFEIVAREYAGRDAGTIALELARAAGWAGMIGGQADDLAGQHVAPSMELTRSIHSRKTGRLFEASCRIGAIVGGIKGSRDQGIEAREEGTQGHSDEWTRGHGDAVTWRSGTEDSTDPGNQESVERLGRFGARLGEAFQIADDILDLTATAEELGKSPGKDAAANKQTYPRCVGVEASKAAAERAVREAVAELAAFGAEADDLRALAGYVVSRNY